MNCYNEHQLFDYINNELSLNKMKEVEKHIQQCAICKKAYHKKREEIKSVIENIHSNDISSIKTPEFIFPDPKENNSTSRIKPLIIRLSVAASLLIIVSISILFLQQKKEQKLEAQLLQIQQELLISDMNEAWHNRELIITQTDKKNKTTKVFLSSEIE